MANFEELRRAASWCDLAESSNRRRHVVCPPNTLCIDDVNAELAQQGLQILESLELIPFPLGLCNGFVLQDLRSGSIYVVLSATFNWQQPPMPNFWDRSINWNQKGQVAQVFVDAAAAAGDTVKLSLRRMAPKPGRVFQVIGFGLAAPIAYFLYQVLGPVASQLGFHVKPAILFACPKFVDSNFRHWQNRLPLISVALDKDWLPRKPVTPLNIQWQWIVTPQAIDMDMNPLFEEPTLPAQTKQCLPIDYIQALAGK